MSTKKNLKEEKNYKKSVYLKLYIDYFLIRRKYIGKCFNFY